ncbi:MAG: hypothetical protein LBD40_00640, partial [Puniceicoccales bacterium]|nr:hypothetical protein [Puniceicoccales bacterium]
MGLEKLGSSSFSAVKAQVEQTYSGKGKWFSGIQAWFSTVKHCLGFKQEKVQQALEAPNSTNTVVPQTPLRGMRINVIVPNPSNVPAAPHENPSSGIASRSAGSRPPEVPIETSANLPQSTIAPTSEP